MEDSVLANAPRYMERINLGENPIYYIEAFGLKKRLSFQTDQLSLGINHSTENIFAKFLLPVEDA